MNTIKSLAIGVILLSFVAGITLNSCTPNKKTDDTENVEATSESEEQPSSSSEHPTSEHPSSGGEHPADSTHSEHPTN